MQLGERGDNQFLWTVWHLPGYRNTEITIRRSLSTGGLTSLSFDVCPQVCPPSLFRLISFRG